MKVETGSRLPATGVGGIVRDVLSMGARPVALLGGVIYAVGVVLYELATGVRPFQGDTQMSVLSSIIKDTPKPISDVRPGLPRELWGVNAGTALSQRIRWEAPNSVNLIRWGGVLPLGLCLIERWDYLAEARAFARARATALDTGWLPPDPPPDPPAFRP